MGRPVLLSARRATQVWWPLRYREQWVAAVAVFFLNILNLDMPQQFEQQSWVAKQRQSGGKDMSPTPNMGLPD